MSKGLFSVVIPTHNEGDWLRRTIDGVLQRTAYPEVEIVVVGDNCTDGSLEFIRSTPNERIQLIDSPEPLGLATAKNLGAHRAAGEYLVFIDSHMIPEGENWLEELRKQLEVEGVGAASLRIPSLENPKAIGYLYTIKDLSLQPTWTLPVVLNEVQKTPLIPGGCFAMQRELFLAIGGFDVLRKWSREDFELSLRLWRLGHNLTTSPRIGILHHFKTGETRGFVSQWEEVVYNSLRSALTLLSPVWAEKVCQHFKTVHKTSYSKVMAELKQDNLFWQRKERLEGEFKRSFEEYIEEYRELLPMLEK